MDNIDIEKRIDDFSSSISGPAAAEDINENEAGGKVIEETSAAANETGASLSGGSDTLVSNQLDSKIISARIDEFNGSNADKAGRMLDEAWNEYGRGDFQKALQLVNSALMAHLRSGAGGAEAVSDSYYCAGEIYMQLDSYQEALTAFDDAEAWLAKSLKKHPAGEKELRKKHKILNGRAFANLILKDLRRAICDIRAATIAIVSAAGSKSVQAARAFSTLAEFLIEDGTGEEAAEFSQKAIETLEYLIERDGPVPIEENNENDEKNEKEINKDKNKVKNKDKKGVSFYDVFNAFGTFYDINFELGRHRVIIENYDKYKKILAVYGLDNASQLARIDIYKAINYYNITDYSSAAEHYLSAAALADKVPADDYWHDILCADSLKGAADAYLKTGEMEACHIYMQRSLPYYLKAITTENERPVEEIINICEELIHTFDSFADAMKIYSAALEVLKQKGAEESLSAGNIYYYAGKELIYKGIEEKGMEYIRAAYELFKKSEREDLAEIIHKVYKV